MGGKFGVRCSVNVATPKHAALVHRHIEHEFIAISTAIAIATATATATMIRPAPADSRTRGLAGTCQASLARSG